MKPRNLVTVGGLALIAFLVIAGTLAHDINFTATALGLVGLLTAILDPLGKRKDDD